MPKSLERGMGASEVIVFGYEHHAFSARRIRRTNSASANRHPLSICRPLPRTSTKPALGSGRRFHLHSDQPLLTTPTPPQVTRQRAPSVLLQHLLNLFLASPSCHALTSATRSRSFKTG